MKSIYSLLLLWIIPSFLSAQIYIQNASPANSNSRNVGVRISKPEAILDISQPVPGATDYGPALRIRSAYNTQSGSRSSGNNAANLMEVFKYSVPSPNTPLFSPVFILNNDGNIGLGTDQLIYRLNIEAPENTLIRLKSNHNSFGSTALFGVVSSNGKAETQIQYENEFGLFDQSSGQFRLKIANNGAIGLGTTTPQAQLHVAGGMIVEGPLEGRQSNGSLNFQLKSNGKLAVGTSNTPNSASGENINAYRLYVKGGILTEEVRVLTGWADYVFEQDYELKPLAEVEAFIDQNGHLPNIPPARIIESKGLELGDITVKQQEKIEEIYLHLIRLSKEIEELKAENAALKQVIQQQ